MRHRFAICCALACLAAAAAAQGNWIAHTNAGEYAFARGDLRRAESEFRAALEIAQGLPAGDTRLETSLENLARLFEHESDFDRAQPMYQLLLAAKEHRLGSDSPALLDTLFAVARVSQPMGDLPTVEESLSRYAAIAASSGAADPRKHWQVLQMLARMETIQERPEQALQWQRRAGEVIADDPSATGEERTGLLESLAEMELLAGNGEGAERVYIEVAEIRTAAAGASEFPRTLAQGAQTALAAGELETAERLAKVVLDTEPDMAANLEASRVLAELSWIEVNRGTNDMATLLAAAGDGPELVRARDRLQSVITLEAADDPEIFSRLAQIEALRGQPASAADWQRRYLEAMAATPEASGGARANLVILLAAAGRWDEALVENAVLLADAEADFGSSDRRLMPILVQRLEILEGAGRKKEAKRIRKRMKTISRS